MRLINTATLEIEEVLDEAKTPPYAILSHTWGDEECSLQDMGSTQIENVQQRDGFKKIDQYCKQALKDGILWAWVDTCCIDKTSTADLSEAINSMFRWYRGASTCYAYLIDVEDPQQFEQSRWFTRGWTLQELVAPAVVEFFDSNWAPLGSKLDLCQQIQKTTGIETDVLITGELGNVSVAHRMSWAANRQTTRVEDLAYCLLGIFNVNLPLLYGEGRRSFVRLQEEIMKGSGDHSLFAWGLPTKIKTMQEFYRSYQPSDTQKLKGLLATSPSDFRFTDRIFPLQYNQSSLPPVVYTDGVRIELKIIRSKFDTTLQFAVIHCTLRPRYRKYLAIPVKPWYKNCVARCGDLVTVAVKDFITPIEEGRCIRLIKAPPTFPGTIVRTNVLRLVYLPSEYGSYYTLDDIHCAPQVSYSREDQTFTLPAYKDTLHAAIIFKPTEKDWKNLLPPKWKEILGRQEEAETFFDQLVRRRGKIHPFCVHQAPFAVLFGGTWENLWIECVPLLRENDCVIELEKMNLFKANNNEVGSWCTRNQLLSRLASGSEEGPCLSDRHRDGSLQVLDWRYGHENTRLEERQADYGRAYQGISVYADIEMNSNNLVEQNLFLFIELARQNPGSTFLRGRRPNWWHLADGD